MTKNKIATFKELIADSEPQTAVVEVGGHRIQVKELSGADRFELAERVDTTRWELLTWVCMQGMTDPKPETVEDLNVLRPEWIMKIATTITDLSGLSDDAVEDAGEE